MRLAHVAVPFTFDLLDSTPQDTSQGKGWTVSGHGAAWAKDLAGNVLEKGCFKQSIADRLDNRGIKIRWMHDEAMGYVTAAAEDDIGLKLDSFVPFTNANQDRVLLMQAGVVDKMSIGFDPDVSSIKYTADERHIGNLTLYEVSFVDLPLNEATGIDGVNALGLTNRRSFYSIGRRTVIKPRVIMAANPPLDIPFADLSTEWTLADALQRVRDFYKVTDTPTADYDKNFIWVAPNSTSLTDRKLLVTDVTGGQDPSGAVGTIAIIPAAVEEAANVVAGYIADTATMDADGIPQDQLDSLKATIDAYYVNMQSAFGDDTLVSPWTDVAAGDEVDGELRNRIGEQFKGAVLNAGNMAKLQKASEFIKEVLASANTNEQEPLDAFASVDWASTIDILSTLTTL